MNRLISKNQLRFAVAAFIVASSLLTKTLYVYTGNQAWIAVIIAAFLSYIVITMYTRLVASFPGYSLIEINEAVFGPVAGSTNCLTKPLAAFVLKTAIDMKKKI